MSKVIMIVSDALRDDVARQYMGYLEHLVETKQATRYTVTGELPSMSRPIYETLHTGVPTSEHGIVNNAIVRRSHMPNVFDLAVKAGKVTAAAAFCWYSELYNSAPFDPLMDREVDNEALAIQHGRFYMSEEFPDLDLYGQGAVLAVKYQPDYLLIHPMGLDTVGERHGGSSTLYHKQAILQDGIISYLMPAALGLGYTILITADHGISDEGIHGGSLDVMRNVPLYVIRPDLTGAGDTDETLSQLCIAPTLCRLLDLPIPSTMKHAPLVI
ncbi:MAG TPA: alkaline phosphatase family protein [Phototrophicaceae bacterium]|jgi:predicted AlkP superfamily pyrophosphatase or phosphodiesterase|nr:alkaline phosphatase family protein [Phototrophicaceae bacterium]